MITKEWLEYEIKQLQKEAGEAAINAAAAKNAFKNAEAAYQRAKEAEINLTACLRGLKDELRILTSFDEEERI